MPPSVLDGNQLGGMLGGALGEVLGEMLEGMKAMDEIAKAFEHGISEGSAAGGWFTNTTLS